MRWVVALIIASISAGTWAGPALADYQAAADYHQAYRGLTMIVIVDGEVVFEDYAHGATAEQPYPITSAAESFSGMMAAAAVQDGILDLDERVSDTLPGWQNSPRETITIRQLLNMTDGLTRRGRLPSFANAARLPPEHTAGEVFAHHSSPLQVFGLVMRRKLSGRNPTHYFNERVLAPFGINIGRWRLGADNNPMMAGGIDLSVREWARYGELILASGQLNGEPLVSEEAFSALFEGSVASPVYGLGFWLNQPIDADVVAATPSISAVTDIWRAPEVFPSDMIMAAGIGHQRLYVSQTRNMVVVRQAGGISQALSGNDVAWSDVDFWRMLEAAPGAPPADVVAALAAQRQPQAATQNAATTPALPGRPRRVLQPDALPTPGAASGSIFDTTIAPRPSIIPGPQRPAASPQFGVPPISSPLTSPGTGSEEILLPPVGEITEEVAEEVVEEEPAEEDTFIGPTF